MLSRLIIKLKSNSSRTHTQQFIKLLSPNNFPITNYSCHCFATYDFANQHKACNQDYFENTQKRLCSSTVQEKVTPNTHFGYKEISEDEKESKVYEVFKNVADTYDVMNDVMSMGIHRLWKDEFVRQLAPQPSMKVLDCAGGTGDISSRILQYVSLLPGGLQSLGELSDPETTHVTVCDINDHMLRVGERRAIENGTTRGISWLHGNAESLPVEDNSYDAVTIAFGIRNCTHGKKVISEAYRVLKPGGRFMCLEFSRVRNSVFRSVYDEYSFQVIPVMGHVIAKDWDSYQYLVESIRKFPDQETFASWIKNEGFKQVTCEDLTFGIAAIHSGFKL